MLKKSHRYHEAADKEDDGAGHEDDEGALGNVVETATEARRRRDVRWIRRLVARVRHLHHGARWMLLRSAAKVK